MQRSIKQQRWGVVAMGVAVTVGLPAHPARSQTEQTLMPPSVFDAYNNARPPYLERRAMGVYQNETQREALSSYQMVNRGGDRRGGYVPFALTGDHSGAARVGIGASFAGFLSGRRLIFTDPLARFGGFGFGTKRAPLGSVGAAFARRQILLAGSSRIAPVLRALQREAAGAAAQRAVERTPYVERDREEPEGVGPAVNLAEFLRSRAELNHRKIRSRAWEYFRNERYLHAARAFDTATSLDTGDNESRIGELFCHAALGADRTALAVFNELLRHDRNPFDHQLTGARTSNLATMFTNPGRVRMWQTAAQLKIGSRDDGPDVPAQHVLILWYLGRTSEAMHGAEALAREFPATPYGSWPAQMRMASDGLGAESRPEP